MLGAAVVFIFLLSTNDDTGNSNLPRPHASSRAVNDLEPVDFDLTDVTFNSLLADIAECKYLDVDSQKLNPSNALVLAHINVRSLHSHYDDLHTFLTSWPNQPDIVCSSETRLNIRDPLINVFLPGYNFIHTKANLHARGVAMYISTKYRYEINRKIDTSRLIDSESTWVIPFTSENTYLVIGIVYRHPTNNKKQFTKGLCNILTSLNLQHKTYFVLGQCFPTSASRPSGGSRSFSR